MKGEVFFEKEFLYTSNVYKKSPYAQKNTAFFTSFFLYRNVMPHDRFCQEYLHESECRSCL